MKKNTEWKLYAYDLNGTDIKDIHNQYFFEFDPHGQQITKKSEHGNIQLLISFTRYSKPMGSFTKSIHLINKDTHEVLAFSGPYPSESEFDDFVKEVMETYIGVHYDEQVEPASKRARKSLFQIEDLTNRLLRLI